MEVSIKQGSLVEGSSNKAEKGSSILAPSITETTACDDRDPVLNPFKACGRLSRLGFGSLVSRIFGLTRYGV